MPANMTEERRAAMAAYGATLINVPAGKMELARDMALEMQVRDDYANAWFPRVQMSLTGEHASPKPQDAEAMSNDWSTSDAFAALQPVGTRSGK